MKTLYNDFVREIDGDFLMEQTEKLWQCEFGQTFRDYHKAAQYTCELMKKAGIPGSEIIMYPADGKTSYNDVRMPIAWDATVGKLTLLNPSDTFVSGVYGAKKNPGKVVADYTEHPFHLIKGSVSTPPGGLKVRIITEQQFLAGEDACNALVMLEPFTHHGGVTLRPVLDRGALGYITDRIGGRYDNPDSISWINAGTEGRGWHVFDGDRPFISFSVSPRTGDYIRNSAKAGGLMGLVECDGKRYSGELPLITGLIPGKRKEEVWIYAHMYEPLSDDDANGVVAGIECARRIMARGTPEYSIRLVFAMELYGYMAYVAQRGNYLRDQVIGGCNFDALGCVKGAELMCFPASDASPFFGNSVMQTLIEELQGEKNAMKCALKSSANFDDMSICDPTIGVASVWPIGEFGDCHHSSVQTMAFLDRETFIWGTAFNTALVYTFANPTKADLYEAGRNAGNNLRKNAARIHEKPFGDPAKYFDRLAEVQRHILEDFKRVVDPSEVDKVLAVFDAEKERVSREFANSQGDPSADNIWRRIASDMVMKRCGHGFPHNLVRIPEADKGAIPDGVIYGHMSNILAAMDGKKNLGEIIRGAEYERNAALDESRIRKYVNAVNLLADHGYLEVIRREALTKKDFVEKLKAVGVKEGDILLIHASTGNFGYVEGGAVTAIEAIKEVIGEKGTALFAAFTRPYIFLSGVNKGWNFRPYDAEDVKQINTGNVVRTLLRKFPNVLRSKHITHSWAGFGPLAAECLSAHGAWEAPCSLNSPMGKAMEKGAKILHLGSSIATTTFLHMIETVTDAPFLSTAICQEKLPDGTIRTGAIARHLPGHRDFYIGFKAFESKFFKKAVEEGLKIHREKLGIGELLLMDSRELFEIGCRIAKADKRIFLCDDPNCLFCSRF